MRVTEDVAKTKRCHRTLGAIGLAEQVISEPANCIASRCMAWRWKINVGIGAIDRSKNDDYSLGYCGLAGD